jgi:hypothetical protein
MGLILRRPLSAGAIRSTSLASSIVPVPCGRVKTTFGFGVGDRGYIAQPQAAPAHALLDRVVAIFWRVTHPKR